MERELLMSGIGGQGVQLAAQLLARAAIRAGRHVQLFGSYGGMMRGGNTDATLILGDEPIQAPPMVGSAWSVVLMHHEFAAPTLARLREGSVLVLNTSVVDRSVADGSSAAGSLTLLPLPASELANDLGAPAAATMVALGAYVAATSIVALDDLVAALPDTLPSYRRQHIAINEQALATGAAAAADSGVSVPAWPAGALA